VKPIALSDRKNKKASSGSGKISRKFPMKLFFLLPQTAEEQFWPRKFCASVENCPAWRNEVSAGWSERIKITKMQRFSFTLAPSTLLSSCISRKRLHHALRSRVLDGKSQQ
jgi:hypothetical protein